eukprot:CAMPEP_0173061988 /NCGR_PEP_ID=MMETSP1102-20130122/3544_1 /TAXON_ID=49646 /ORGANISM="Geminigera sp., Strain Caron Lab Isolate" /LENGTH=510 /DNA_ID=CAMNT_0013928561 /DNA_START=626 /DNA_END=2158 /DNA_ORIENTATION=+
MDDFTHNHNVSDFHQYFPFKQKSWNYPVSLDNMIKQWNSIEKVWKLMVMHEQRKSGNNSINRNDSWYQRVGIFRSDVLYKNNINISDGSAVTARFQNFKLFRNDRIFYGIREHAEKWACGRFGYVDQYMRTDFGKKHLLHSETFLFQLMTHWNISFSFRDICFHRVRATGYIMSTDCNYFHIPSTDCDYLGTLKKNKSDLLIPSTTLLLSPQSRIATTGKSPKPKWNFTASYSTVRPVSGVLHHCNVTTLSPHWIHNNLSPPADSDFVIYASMIGNFRNEEEGISDKLNNLKIADQIPPIPGILFTDNPMLKIYVKGWMIVRVAKDEVVGTIPGKRVTTKRLKFMGHFHPALQPYRYLIHMDTSGKTFRNSKTALEGNIRKYVRCHPQYYWFGRHHPDRTKMEQEIRYMVEKKKHLQHPASLRKWRDWLNEGDKQRMKQANNWLPETNFWVIDTHHEDFLCSWKDVYDTMIKWDIWRDQLVWNWTMRNWKKRIHFFDPGQFKIPEGCRNP